MTPEEYKTFRTEIRNNAALAEHNLKIEYINSINKYPVGSIFTDHIGSIKVAQFEPYHIPYVDGIPTIKYYGVELKKDGTQKAKLKYRDAYLSNEVKK